LLQPAKCIGAKTLENHVHALAPYFSFNYFSHVYKTLRVSLLW